MSSIALLAALSEARYHLLVTQMFVSSGFPSPTVTMLTSCGPYVLLTAVSSDAATLSSSGTGYTQLFFSPTSHQLTDSTFPSLSAYTGS